METERFRVLGLDAQEQVLVDMLNAWCLGAEAMSDWLDENGYAIAQVEN